MYNKMKIIIIWVVMMATVTANKNQQKQLNMDV